MPKPAQPKKKRIAKLFVLDTNVLMHDPTSLFRFEEHDVYVPIGTLEELDNHKRGMSDVARNARQASRFLDEIVSRADGRHQGGHRSGGEGGRASQRTPVPADRSHQRANCRQRWPSARPTTRSSRWCAHLQTRDPKRQVILVSKDINMRIKAHALGAGGGGLHQRQGARGQRPAVHRRACAAAGLLGRARARHGVLEEGRPYLLPRARPAGAEAAAERIRLRRVERPTALCDRQGTQRVAAPYSRPCATTRT